MAKSRTKRARNKELQGFRKFLFWFFACGSHIVIEKDELDEANLNGEYGRDNKPEVSPNISEDAAEKEKLSKDKKRGPGKPVPKRPPAPKRPPTPNKGIDTTMVEIALDDKKDTVKKHSVESVDDTIKKQTKAVPKRPPPPKKATSQRSPGVILSICELDRTMNVPLFDIIQGDDFATVRRQTALEEAAFGDAAGPPSRPPPPKHIVTKGSNLQEKAKRPNRPPLPKRPPDNVLETNTAVNNKEDRTDDKHECLVVQDGVPGCEDDVNKTLDKTAVDEYPDYLNPFADDSDADDDDRPITDDGNATCDDDDCVDDENKSDDDKEKDTKPNSIEDYPEDLNPFAEDDDVTIEITDEY